MLSRCLDRAPAADDLVKVVDVYHDDLVDHGLRDPDAERVAAAIAAAGRMAERWPRPVDIIRHLPPRPSLRAIEVQPVDRETALDNVRTLKAAVAHLMVPRGAGRGESA